MSAEAPARAEREGSAQRTLPTSAPLEYTTLAAFAAMLGKDCARAARDWCRRHGVPYRRDGKHNWVRVDDVRRAIEGLPQCHSSNTNERAAAVAAAVAAMTGKK